MAPLKDKNIDVLRRLCALEEDRGMALKEKADKLAANPLVKAGLVWYIEAAGLRLYIATKEGRAFLRDHEETK